MRLAKRTYSLPPALLQRFEARLGSGERSEMIARLIGEWLDELDRAELREQVIAGCTDMAQVYLDMDKEWNGAADEAWRELE